MSKFILGTANFSGTYGLAQNKNIVEKQLQEIILFAQENGINHFDTATGYGNAQSILGRFIDKSKKPKIDSKIGQKDCESVSSILATVKKTIDCLGVEKLSTLYLHDSKSLLKENQNIVKTGLNKLIDLGLVDHIGVSAYTLSEVILCKNTFSSLTRFQVPENICDRRLVNSKKLMDLSISGDQINVRSIFLQGLLVMDIHSIPIKLKKASKIIQEFEYYSKSIQSTRAELCTAYALNIPWASKILIGVESQLQLQEILKFDTLLIKDWSKNIQKLDESIVDPRNW
jgi:aryl-alcohol dehydrogenase-like predicted oxidoreductase